MSGLTGRAAAEEADRQRRVWAGSCSWWEQAHRPLCPLVRHRSRAQRTSGLESGGFTCLERPVWGICAALPQNLWVRVARRTLDLRCTRI